MRQSSYSRVLIKCFLSSCLLFLFIGCRESIQSPLVPPQKTVQRTSFPTTLPERSATPVSSSRVTRIAFAAVDNQGNSDIYTVDSDGSKMTRLTDTGRAYHPTWSPRGAQLAFVSTEDGLQSAILVMNSSGTQTREIIRLASSEFANELAWSPVDQLIIVQLQSYSLPLITADGQELQRIGIGVENRHPRWAPNGDRIVFEFLERHRAPWGLAVIDAKTGRTVMSRIPDFSGVCEDCPNYLEPTWSPNNDQIAFYADGQIAIMSIVDGEPMIITKGSAGGREPSWSLDGKQIAFLSRTNSGDDIYLIHPDGSQVARLTQDGSLKECPTWSPDSKQIAFLSELTGNPEIYVINADGTDQRRLTNNDLKESCPMWSPN